MFVQIFETIAAKLYKGGVCDTKLLEFDTSGSENFRILTCPSAILRLSYSSTKKDNPVALLKFFLLRTNGRVESLDSIHVQTKMA